MNPAIDKIGRTVATLRTHAAARAQERAERRELAAQLSNYTSPADRLELHEALARHTDEESAQIRRIMAGSALV